MSSIIEANAYAQDFQISDVTVTNTGSQFQALIGFLIVMLVAAFAGVAFSAPIVTIATGVITAIAVPFIAIASVRSTK